MNDYIGIVKLENGNVRLVNAFGQVSPTLPGPAILRITQDRKKVQVRQQNGANEYLVHACIQYTQILPAAAVAFDPNTQDIDELAALLDTYFFFELAEVGAQGPQGPQGIQGIPGPSGGPTYPVGVTVIEGSYLAETTTGAGNSTNVLNINTLVNQVVNVEVRATCGKSGVAGHARRTAGREFSVNAGAILQSASIVLTSPITTSFNTPVLAISVPASSVIITVTNATQDTSWFIEYRITIQTLP